MKHLIRDKSHHRVKFLKPREIHDLTGSLQGASPGGKAGHWGAKHTSG